VVVVELVECVFVFVVVVPQAEMQAGGMKTRSSAEDGTLAAHAVSSSVAVSPDWALASLALASLALASALASASALTLTLSFSVALASIVRRSSRLVFRDPSSETAVLALFILLFRLILLLDHAAAVPQRLLLHGSSHLAAGSLMARDEMREEKRGRDGVREE
jgi:hypothetical protein